MDLLIGYLRQKLKSICIFIVFFAIFIISFMLYHLPLCAVLYPIVLCIIIGIVYVIIDFLQLKRMHDTLTRINSISDLADENFPIINSICDKDYQDIIHIIKAEHDKYCIDMNNKYEDMINYYTVWAHQIKTPISSMRLNLQNEDSALSRKILADLFRVEQYVEMVLTFLRLNSNSTDYVFKEYDLDKIIKNTIKKFASEFINRKISLLYEPIDEKIVTDEKWLSFVIEQVISNALKYTPKGNITITYTNDKKLCIQDTGIGIAKEDIPRIFENGYTGYNGRINKRSSGIGLYLCKCICDKLGYKISAESIPYIGTTIIIDLMA